MSIGTIAADNYSEIGISANMAIMTKTLVSPKGAAVVVSMSMIPVLLVRRNIPQDTVIFVMARPPPLVRTIRTSRVILLK